MHCAQHQQEKKLFENFFPPPPSEKKLITWSGSDEGRIALHSLDRDLRLALSNFLIIQETK